VSLRKAETDAVDELLMLKLLFSLDRWSDSTDGRSDPMTQGRAISRRERKPMPSHHYYVPLSFLTSRPVLGFYPLIIRPKRDQASFDQWHR
jgi:hypothetical protein